MSTDVIEFALVIIGIPVGIILAGLVGWLILRRATSNAIGRRAGWR